MAGKQAGWSILVEDLWFLSNSMVARENKGSREARTSQNGEEKSPWVSEQASAWLRVNRLIVHRAVLCGVGISLGAFFFRK